MVLIRMMLLFHEIISANNNVGVDRRRCTVVVRDNETRFIAPIATRPGGQVVDVYDVGKLRGGSVRERRRIRWGTHSIAKIANRGAWKVVVLLEIIDQKWQAIPNVQMSPWTYEDCRVRYTTTVIGKPLSRNRTCPPRGRGDAVVITEGRTLLSQQNSTQHHTRKGNGQSSYHLYLPSCLSMALK